MDVAWMLEASARLQTHGPSPVLAENVPQLGFLVVRPEASFRLLWVLVCPDTDEPFPPPRAALPCLAPLGEPAPGSLTCLLLDLNTPRAKVCSWRSFDKLALCVTTTQSRQRTLVNYVNVNNSIMSSSIPLFSDFWNIPY